MLVPIILICYSKWCKSLYLTCLLNPGPELPLPRGSVRVPEVLRPPLGGGAGDLLQDGQDQEEHLKSENVSDVSYFICISEHCRLIVWMIYL